MAFYVQPEIELNRLLSHVERCALAKALGVSRQTLLRRESSLELTPIRLNHSRVYYTRSDAQRAIANVLETKRGPKAQRISVELQEKKLNKKRRNKGWKKPSHAPNWIKKDGDKRKKIKWNTYPTDPFYKC
jgi:hypothetical protein